MVASKIDASGIRALNFSLSPTKRQNKLACLPLTCYFQARLIFMDTARACLSGVPFRYSPLGQSPQILSYAGVASKDKRSSLFGLFVSAR